MSGLFIGRRYPDAVGKIEVVIADHGLIPLSEIRKQNRSREIVEVRHLIWGLIREELGLSYPQIAAIYERDHTTIINGVVKAKASGNLPAAKKLVEERFPGIFDQL